MKARAAPRSGGPAEAPSAAVSAMLAVVAWSAVAALLAAAALPDGAATPDAAAGEASGFVHAAVAPPVCRIDQSTAPAAELALLPEVGPLLAARIAADRAVHGPFRSVDELARVPGFGERRIAELRDAARATAP